MRIIIEFDSEEQKPDVQTRTATSEPTTSEPEAAAQTIDAGAAPEADAATSEGGWESAEDVQEEGVGEGEEDIAAGSVDAGAAPEGRQEAEEEAASPFLEDADVAYAGGDGHL